MFGIIPSLLCVSARQVLNTMLGSLDGVAKSSMSKAVQQGTFWQFPGKVANLVESQARQHGARCSTMLRDVKGEYDEKLMRWWAHVRLKALRDAERAKREAAEAALRPASPPPPPRIRRNATARGGRHAGRDRGNASATRGGKRGHGRKASKAATSGRLVTEPPPGAQGRQECFTVYD